jgi:hypothetical protein
LLRRKLGGFERVLEDLRKSLRVWIAFHRRICICFDRPNVAHEAVAGDFVPLSAERLLVRLFLREVNRMNMRMPAFFIAIGDLVAPHRTGNLGQQGSRSLPMATLVQSSETALKVQQPFLQIDAVSHGEGHEIRIELRMRCAHPLKPFQIARHHSGATANCAKTADQVCAAEIRTSELGFFQRGKVPEKQPIPAFPHLLHPDANVSRS